MKVLLIILAVTAVSVVSFITYIVLSNPSAEDHQAASILYRAALEKHNFGDKLSFSPHPSKIFLNVKGSFSKEEKSLIKSKIRDLADELRLDRRIIINFEEG